MLTFNQSKRMQLLVGSKVKCIKAMQGFFVIDFVYAVTEANMVMDKNGGLHSWTIETFRNYFKELPNANL